MNHKDLDVWKSAMLPAGVTQCPKLAVGFIKYLKGKV